MRATLAFTILLMLASARVGAGTAPEEEPRISVGGTYATAVTLERWSCASRPHVEEHPTTVRHKAGSTALTLIHAGSRYQGELAADGSFSTTPDRVTMSGVGYTVTIAGSFTTTAIAAVVTVEVSGPRACTYLVRWEGPKRGEPNVLPGATADPSPGP